MSNSLRLFELAHVIIPGLCIICIMYMYIIYIMFMCNYAFCVIISFMIELKSTNQCDAQS